MNSKIPFTKDISFGKKISEITSISLEHEIKVEDSILKGTFIVSGDYKSHEVSINKEPFSYQLPFEITLSDDIDTDTIEFMIDDFTYEVKDNNLLRVNIDFNVIASVKENISSIEEDIEEVEKIVNKDREDEENVCEDAADLKRTISVQTFSEDKEKVKEEIEESSDETIISSAKNLEDDEYTTYHIHMISDGENVETICTMYNSNINLLSDYNDLNNIVIGDKLIIPDNNE